MQDKTSADLLWNVGLDKAEDLRWGAPRGQANLEHNYYIMSRAKKATGWTDNARGEHRYQERKTYFDTICRYIGHQPKIVSGSDECGCCDGWYYCGRCYADYDDGQWIRA